MRGIDCVARATRMVEFHQGATLIRYRRALPVVWALRPASSPGVIRSLGCALGIRLSLSSASFI